MAADIRPQSLAQRIQVRVPLARKGHAIDGPASGGARDLDLDPRIDGNGDRRLPVNDGMLTEEDALARGRGDHHATPL